jgi:hypothetical protein
MAIVVSGQTITEFAKGKAAAILRRMPIQVQPTPNPNAMKFVLGRQMFARPFSFPSAQAAAGHAPAEEIFALAGVYNVFMVQDFVTVNKLPDVPWEPLVPAVQAILAEYITSYVTSHESGVA